MNFSPKIGTYSKHPGKESKSGLYLFFYFYRMEIFYAHIHILYILNINKIPLIKTLTL